MQTFSFVGLARHEDGYATLTCLFVLTVSLLVGGAAIDTANAWRVREILQTNAETAALSAAIRASEPRLGETPLDVARRTAMTGLQVAKLEDAWHPGSFEMGYLDEASREFSPNSYPANSVRVTLDRNSMQGNPEPLLFLKVFNYDPWNIRGRATALIKTRSGPACTDPLLSLQARVDLSSTNAFIGICLKARADATYGDMPVWDHKHVTGLIDELLTMAVTPTEFNVFGGRGISRGEVQRAVNTATRNIHARDLNNISVLSNGSFRVDCDDNEVVRLSEGFVVENAAIFSDCPIKFEGEVKLKASLVVSNLVSVLHGLGDISVTPDAVLTGSPACAPGDGLRVLLNADLHAVSNIPALASTKTPLGALIDQTVADTGTVLDQTLATLGPVIGGIAEDVSEITTNFDLLPVCQNVATMIDGDTVTLR
ncbi:pilus assembly protein TadG-related protein [Puniceibacterium confluentis]|uniref:Tad domain-containing protein n=1 Tax=Puniceibacterium confluentis TaxID=1958944 RepID=UPI003F6DDC67